MNHGKRMKIFYITATVMLSVILLFGISEVFSAYKSTENIVIETSVSTDTTVISQTKTTEKYTTTTQYTEPVIEILSEPTTCSVYPERDDNAQRFSNDYKFGYALLMNTDTKKVVAYRNANAKMFPASLTKIMSLIVAVENMENLSYTVTITEDMINPMIELDASRAGFLPDETPTLEDLLYGMVLMSGADATLAVAEYVAGSEMAFVQLMNEKAVELGLKSTHFTNAVGLHDNEHYSTATDMALILEYAIQNEICRKIISAYEYKVPPTEKNPEGLTFTSNFFSRMYGDEMPDVTIQGGKTGYTDKAGNCIESFAEINGETYILVMCKCTDKWSAVYDTLSIYSVYGTDGEKYVPSSKRK